MHIKRALHLVGQVAFRDRLHVLLIVPVVLEFNLVVCDTLIIVYSFVTRVDIRLTIIKKLINTVSICRSLLKLVS